MQLDAATDVTAHFDIIHYPLTVTRTGGGTGTVTSAPAGVDCGATCSHRFAIDTEVTLTAEAAPGTRFAGWAGACGGVDPCVVTMGGPVDVEAMFIPQRTVTVAVTGAGVVQSGYGIDCGAQCSTIVDDGTTVDLQAYPDPGWVVAGWTEPGCTGTTCLVDVRADRTVGVEFAREATLIVTRTGTGTGTVTSTPAGVDCGPTCTGSFALGQTVTLVATPDAHAQFTGWSGACTGTGPCVVTMDLVTMVTASFDAAYTLTVTRLGNGSGVVTSSPAGIDCGASCASAFTAGTAVTLTATATPGSLFTGWQRQATQTYAATGPVAIPDASATGARLDVAVPAFTFDSLQVAVDIQHPFIGDLVVTLLHDGVTVATLHNRAGGGADNIVQTYPVTTAGTAAGGTWSLKVVDAAAGDVGAIRGVTLAFGVRVTSTDPTLTVTVGADQSVAATFVADYTLRVTKAGTGTGTLTESHFALTCGAGCGGFTGTHLGPGTAIHIEAVPDPGVVFIGWSGACTGTGACDVVMTGNVDITATFGRTHQLTVARAGAGTGTVTSLPAGIACGAACTTTVLEGVPVSLTAEAAPGSVFTGWSPAVAGCTGPVCALASVTADTTLTATFEPSVALTIEVIGGDGVGAVQAAGDLASCTGTCTRDYAIGSVVTLTALPPEGLAAWGGACAGTGACQVTLSTSRTVTATFRPRYPLTVTRAGPGGGLVTSMPAGIACGGTCTASFFATQRVTLRAEPDDTSAFAGWSGGGCHGTNACTITIADATAVTATFAVWTPPRVVTVPPLPPADPDPDAEYDSQGRRVFAHGVDLDLVVDETPSAITAVATCGLTVTHCVQVGAGTVDECLWSMPRCATDTPWTEATPCCADACWDGYQAARRHGVDASSAFVGALFGRPSCMPGVDDARGGDSVGPVMSFRQEMLQLHNQRRDRHCVHHLEWSPTLAAASQAWADYLAANDLFEHSPAARAGTYGENLEMDNSATMSDTERADLWYQEIRGYDYANPGNILPGYSDPASGNAIGHFTAMVWKATQAVGCAKAHAGDKTYLVCNYGPAGNVPGKYAQNVLPVCAP